jgi:folylpolyglutamate synthase/dihydropteroate synthase
MSVVAGGMAKVVVTAETSIAGDVMRSMSASVLDEAWYHVAKEHNLDAYRYDDPDEALNGAQKDIVITREGSVINALKTASLLLASMHKKGVICVTGSLHAVAAVLSLIEAGPNHT